MFQVNQIALVQNDDSYNGCVVKVCDVRVEDDGEVYEYRADIIKRISGNGYLGQKNVPFGPHELRKFGNILNL